MAPSQRCGRLLLILFMFSVAWGGGQVAEAQEVGRVGRVNAAGVPFYVYTEAGQPTIQVNVVGGNAGGIYQVGDGVRFDEFLTIAAPSPGVQGGARQQITVRLYRMVNSERTMLLEQRMEDILQANPDTYPTLQDGDFINIEVRTRQRFGWRDGLRILTSVSTVLLLIERFTRVF